jgi:RimJ/RimL family protein N-acetyltransferase
MFAITQRLLLRPGWIEDASALHAAIADPGIVRNLATAPWPYRPQDAEDFLSRDRDPCEPAMLVFLRTGGAPELIGGVGFSRTPGGGIEFGYWLARRAWGRGYATEAGCALLANARDSLRLKRIEAGHFLDNPASGRVLEKLGFRATGRTVARYSLGRDSVAPVREMVLDLCDDEDCAPMRECIAA